MAKKLLGLALAILMAVPTLSFAQEDVFEAARNEPRGVRVLLVLRDGATLRGTLVSVDSEALVVGQLDPVTQPMTLRNARGIRGAFVFRPTEVVRVAVERSDRASYAEHDGDPANPELVRHVVSQLRPGTTIDVRTRDGRSRRTRLVGAGADAFQIAQRRGTATVAYADVTAVGPAGRSGLKKGILAGVGVCVAGGLAVLGYFAAVGDPLW